ncbi:hypothetical protein ACQEVG_18385 [Streptomyces sp. CA-135486]
MDLESIADELYGLAPEDFIDARSQHVAAAAKPETGTWPGGLAR